MKNFGGIHETALVGDGVRLGKGVTVGPRAIIYDNVDVGNGTHIGADVILGEPLAGVYRDDASYSNPRLEIGHSSIVRSGSIVYAGSRFGPRLETGHRVTIREGTVAGENFRIGTLSDVQGHCEIGDFVRLHSNVHVGQKSSIASYVWVFPYVVLTNDPHPPSDVMIGVCVEEFAVIATMSVVLPGVRVGADALVGAGSVVSRDVPPATVVAGSPAKPVAKVADIKSKVDGTSVYPWRETFDRGMPWEGIGYEAWRRERHR